MSQQLLEIMTTNEYDEVHEHKILLVVAASNEKQYLQTLSGFC
jgi:hypothetical protein